MTDAQVWRIQELEKSTARQQSEIEDLKDEIQTLKLERQYLMGMSKMGGWMVRGIVALAGYGGFRLLVSVAHWLNMPMK